MKQTKFVVTEPHRSEYPSPITFEKGAPLRIGEKYSGSENWEDWYFCSTPRQKDGWVPGQVIEWIDDNSGIAKEAYTAKELNVDAGEVVIGSKELNGWIWCRRISQPEEGWVPLKNIREAENIADMDKNPILKDSLINHYLPADYIDSFSKVVVAKENITPDAFFDMAFNQFPGWIEWLLKLRNTLVKPLGLDTKSRFTDCVYEKNTNEIIWGMPDKHLNFHVSMWYGEHMDGKQELRVTTVVKYNNWLGRIYFFVIRPFHGIIISALLKSIARRQLKKDNK